MSCSGDTIDSLLARASNTASQLNLKWLVAAGHEERFTVLRNALNHCYRELVDNRQVNLEGQVGEDQLSVQICQMLGGMGIHASHDPQVGGHVDILVKDRDGFLWVGEAKIDRGPAYVAGGFDQLSTRYGTAGDGRNHGEMIIYTWFPKMAERLRKWQDHLVGTANVDGLQIVDPIKDPKWYFTTKHLCPATGHAFNVRHVYVPLYFQPKK